MQESFNSVGSVFKLPFVVIYAAYLFSLSKVYQWMLKHGKPIYVKKRT